MKNFKYPNLVFLLLMWLFMGRIQAQSPQNLIVDCPPQFNLTEGEAYDTSVTGSPVILANDGGAVTITYIEIFNKGTCQNHNDVVTRIFTIRNAAGEQSRCTQLIYLKHLTTSQIYIPADTMIEYPKDISLSEALLGHGLNLAEVKITFIDTKISSGCTIPMRIRRLWKIDDLCSGTLISLTSFITLRAYQNSFLHNSQVVTNLCDNEGAISITPKGEFGPYSYQWNNGASSSTLTNLIAGVYTVIVSDQFKCNQLLTFGLDPMSTTADIGGRIRTANDYRVIPDSVSFSNPTNVKKFCFSQNGGLHYGFLVKQKTTGLVNYNFTKKSDPLNSVSTKDILLIQKHILGLNRLDSLRYLAADVNNNFNVTASDISELRKLVLGVIGNFNFVDSWYFLKNDWKSFYKSNQTIQSLLFTGVTIVNYPRQNADVIAVKMGDIDLSYKNNFASELLELRSNTLDCSLNMTNTIVQANKDIDIPVYFNAAQYMYGLQFLLKAKSSLLSMEMVSSQLEPEFWNLNNQNLKISWSTGTKLEWNPKEPLFVLRLRTSESIRLDELLSLDPSYLNEYYDDQESSWKLNLNVQHALSSDIQYLIYPNPTNEGVFVQSNSDEPSQITFYNAMGREVRSSTFSNSVYIPTHDFYPGSYFYKVTNRYTTMHTGKIVVIK